MGDNSPLHFETFLIHGGLEPGPAGATTIPIVQSSAFAHATAEDLEDVFRGRKAGQIYTRLIFIETIGNPKMDVPDISVIASIARETGIPLMVDATVSTPYLAKGRNLGADLVIHSTSKYINGTGSVIGGAIIDCGTFNGDTPRFPHFAPFVKKHRQFACSARLRKLMHKDFGASPAPMNSFLLSEGLEKPWRCGWNGTAPARCGWPVFSRRIRRCAAEKMRAINPDVTVHTYQEWVSAANIADLIAGYDFIIDGTDNFAAKFLINDACVFGNKPYSHGGILQFVGQTLTVCPGESPCYRCIFPQPPPKDAIPTLLPGGRDRRPSGGHRHHPGNGGGQIPAGKGRAPGREHPYVRRPRHGFPEGGSQAHPPLSHLR